MTNHPIDETLAAFIDGELDDAARRRVVEHLTECAECRDIVLMADEVAVEIEPVPAVAAAANVVPGAFGKKWIAPLAAAASLVLVLFLGRDQVTNQLDGGMTGVHKAYSDIEQRDVASRLSGFEYKPLKRRMRGPEDDDLALTQLQIQYDKLTNETGTRSWKEYRALAAVSLLIGKRDAAVKAIEAAEKLAPNEPAVINDLAAVYIEQAPYDGNTARAVAAAERAWKLEQTPESAWNRAQAYAVAGRDADAIRAWEEYLKLYPDPAWTEEAQKNLEDLRPDPLS
jgi:tetratricopeptide (TPR) repeat protein